MWSMLKFLFLFVFISNAFAAYVAVLETVAMPDVKEKVSLSDRQFLTNVLREQAVQELPVEQNFTIMTRENINAMLPPGKSIEDCEGNCMVETGRNIAADYVCQMHLGSFDGAFSLSAELYETAANKLIASFNGQGASVKELLEIIKEKSPNFFRKVKSSSGFAGVGGISEVGGSGDFSFAGKKKFIVEITSTPTEAVPTIDGKAIPKCLSTPCKVQLEEGSHRFVASKEHYDDAETVVEINKNNQIVDLKLEPNFGWLVVNPVLAGPAATKGKLNVTVDAFRMQDSIIELETGVHKIRLTHPCYDPIEFKVAIAKQQTEIFDKEMVRGKGGLELNAEYRGEPQAVTVVIDGVEYGSTPYTGEVPLCANIFVKGKGWAEQVNVKPKWHDVVKRTHRLRHSPDSVDSVNYSSSSWSAAIGSKSDTFDTKANVDESIPTNVEYSNSKTTKWIILGASSAVTVTGIVLAAVGNSKAKEASKKEYSSKSEFKKYRKDAESGQALRGVGVGLAIVGAIGIGVSFAF